MPKKKKVAPDMSAQKLMDELQPIAATDFAKPHEIVIQFVGKRKVLNKETGIEETVYREAPTLRRNGARVIELPSSTEQRKGFTHPDAEFLLTAYPKVFKRKRSKGEK
jgi:hypothetical protein